VNWTDEAKQALSRVPFFVRKRVKKRVEEEAERFGEILERKGKERLKAD